MSETIFSKIAREIAMEKMAEIVVRTEKDPESSLRGKLTKKLIGHPSQEFNESMKKMNDSGLRLDMAVSGKKIKDSEDYDAASDKHFKNVDLYNRLGIKGEEINRESLQNLGRKYDKMARKSEDMNAMVDKLYKDVDMVRDYPVIQGEYWTGKVKKLLGK